MVLIPNDVGTRLRLQTESALLQATSPVKRVENDLLDLTPGQRFSARIEHALPDNSYRALVAGKSITLALPEGATVGDSLELVVLERTSESIIAQRASTAPANSTAYQFTTLSPAAKLIGNLLPAEGTPASPVLLNKGEPIFAQPPVSSSQLANSLANAVITSGLFYESHQAQWINGQIGIAQLLDEPQAQHSDFPTLVRSMVAEHAREVEVGGQASSSDTAAADQTDAAEQKSAAVGRRTDVADSSNDPSMSLSKSSGEVLNELRPLVQHQLEALANQRMVWHGELWPQQAFEWSIEPDDSRQTASAAEERAWLTSLSVTAPNLGSLQARLEVLPNGVRIVMATEAPETEAALQTAIPQLESALSADGIPLLAMIVRHVPTDSSSEPGKN